MKRPSSLLCFLTSFTLVGDLWAESSSDKPTLKAAIFVNNRAGKEFDDKIRVFEDFVTSGATKGGFSIVSTEIVAEGLGKGAKLDEQLGNNISAWRLAQILGADWILSTSITTFGTEKKTFEGDGIKTVNVIHTLRVSYKIVDGTYGFSRAADTLGVSKTIRFTENTQTINSDLINKLLEKASLKVADSLGQVRDKFGLPPPPPNAVQITVACGMTDLAQLPISVPDIRVLDDGTVLVQSNRLGVDVLVAMVEFDGIAVGSAPGKFKVRPGLSKMRVKRAGFNDYESTANFSEGQSFKVPLQMSEAGYARWKDNTTFLLGIETGKKLTDATVKAIEGFAKLLEQSGYRVDTRTDVKANIATKGKSLFDGATFRPKLFGK